MNCVNIQLESDSTGDIMQRHVGSHSIVLGGKFIFGLVDTSIEEKVGLPLFALWVTSRNFLAAN